MEHCHSSPTHSHCNGSTHEWMGWMMIAAIWMAALPAAASAPASSHGEGGDHAGY